MKSISLLMTPEDWRILIRAVGALNDHLSAANGLKTDKLGNADQAETVLERRTVRLGLQLLGVAHAPQEISRLNTYNEWCRYSVVRAALAQSTAIGNLPST